MTRKLFCSPEADRFIWLTQQDLGAEHSQDVALSASPPPTHQEEQPSVVPDGEDAGPINSTEPSTKDQEENHSEEGTSIQTEQQKTEEEGGESDEEESKGLKRKREEMHREEEAGPSTEKKRVRNLWLMVDLQPRAKRHCEICILSRSVMVRCRNLIAKLLH